MTPYLTLCILLILLHIQPTLSVTPVELNLCHQLQTHHYIDISEAVIEKTQKIEYYLQLYNSPIYINRTAYSLVLTGKFSKLILKKYGQNKEESLYHGTQLHVKIPPNHVYNLQKIPQLEIQIIHQLQKSTVENSTRFVIVSQMYVASKMTNKIETVLSSFIHPQLKDGDVIPTSKLIKLIEGFPMLMYQGSAETYPCRKDLLCFVKRQYQLIGQQDFRSLKTFLNFESRSNKPKKAFRRKKLLQVPAMKKPVESKTIQSQQL